MDKAYIKKPIAVGKGQVLFVKNINIYNRLAVWLSSLH